MKLSKLIRIKDTNSLFSDKYQYKIVIVCPIAAYFRSADFSQVRLKLDLLKQGQRPFWIKIKGPDDISFCYKMLDVLIKYNDFNIRVEQPYLNYYTNDTKAIEELAAIDSERISYVSMPNKNNPSLQQRSVILKKIDYDYKVFLGKTTQNYNSFLTWTKNNDLVKLTKRAQNDLSKNRSFGGSYLYVKNEKALTLVRVFIGSCISKVETVIKA